MEPTVSHARSGKGAEQSRAQHVAPGPEPSAAAAVPPSLLLLQLVSTAAAGIG
jgi:hypothetical protein